MKVFDNISKLEVGEVDRNNLIRVIKELIFLRKDKTNKYYNNYLSSDKHIVE